MLTGQFSERFIRKVSLILPIQVPLDTLLSPPSSVCGGNLYLFIYSSRGQPLYTRLKRLRCKLLFLLPGDRSNKLLRIRFLKFSSTYSFLQVTSFFNNFRYKEKKIIIQIIFSQFNTFLGISRTIKY